MADASPAEHDRKKHTDNAPASRERFALVGGSPVRELATGESGAGTAASERVYRLQGPACMEDIDLLRGASRFGQASGAFADSTIRTGYAAISISSWWVQPGLGKHSWRRPLTESLPDFTDGFTALLRHRRTVVSRTGVSAGGRQLCSKLATRAGAGGCTDSLTIGRCRHWRRANAEPSFLEICDERYLTRSNAVDQPVAGCEVACADRRPHDGRQYFSGPSGACGAPGIELAGRVHAQEEGRTRRQRCGE